MIRDGYDLASTAGVVRGSERWVLVANKASERKELRLGDAMDSD